MTSGLDFFGSDADSLSLDAKGRGMDILGWLVGGTIDLAYRLGLALIAMVC